MKLKITLFVFIACAFLYACKKEEATYKLSGYAFDGRSGNALSAVAASIEKQVVSGGSFGAVFTQATSSSSDVSGAFTLEWPRENFAALKLKASRSNYITAEKNLLVSDFEGGNTVQENITIFPESFIAVKIQNTGENHPEDLINFTFTNADFDCVCCANGFKVFEGADVDTQYTCKLYGDTWLKFQKQIYTLDSDTIANDSIWCPSFQTTELLIQY